jgi:outer membrane protein assembly factor BamB
MKAILYFKAFCLSFGLLVFASLSLKAATSYEWPLWRGPSQNGLASPGQDLPTEWSDSKNVIWKTKVPGRGHGSPIVVGNQVILPTSDEQKKTQSVLCLNRSTGKLLWTTQVHKGGFMKLNKKGTHASGSLACDGKQLYVNFLNAGAAHTTALSMDGTILWQTRITDYVVHQAYASSPALHGENLLLVAADNKKSGALACLDRTNGKIIWKVGRPKKTKLCIARNLRVGRAPAAHHDRL